MNRSQILKESECWFLLYSASKLLLRWRVDDSPDIFFLFSNENICCDPSLEPSRRDGSDNGSHHIFMKRPGKISLNFLSGPLGSLDLLWVSKKVEFFCNGTRTVLHYMTDE